MGSAKRDRAVRFTWRRSAFALIVVAGLTGWWLAGHSLPLASLAPSTPTDSNEMVWIEGGRFLMGSDVSPDPAARPQHPVVVRSFWLDRHEVTNAQFAEFVAATGYLSTAERHGQGWVFEPLRHAWALVPGAEWRHPFGPHSSIADQEHRPVVMVSWYDAVAYAEWAGKRLPTEAEWEFAARAGAYDADFPWGRQAQSAQEPRANSWQGWFPECDLGLDGCRELANVGTFPPNGYGLLDMSGNVWEWCADWYSQDYYRTGESEYPTGPKHQPSAGRRVQRGGSWLSAENLNPEIQVWARGAGPPEVGRNHLGFRCARNANGHNANERSSDERSAAAKHSRSSDTSVH
jgi:formylglycine-generating enzyme